MINKLNLKFLVMIVGFGSKIRVYTVNENLIFQVRIRYLSQLLNNGNVANIITSPELSNLAHMSIGFLSLNAEYSSTFPTNCFRASRYISAIR